MSLNLGVSFKFPYIEKFAFLVKDGILLPLIASIYLFDRITLSVIPTCFPVVMIIFNVGLLREIHQKRTEKSSKQGVRENLIDLIGKHDTIYLFALSSATLGILGLFDALFRASLVHLLNTVYYLFSAY